MAEAKFETVSFSVWHKDAYSSEFTLDRICRKPRPIWEVKDSSGNSVGQGYSTDEAVESLAEYLNVGNDEFKRSRMAYECRKDSKLVYRIRVEGDGCQIYDSNDAPVGNKIFDTYTEARAYCEQILS